MSAPAVCLVPGCNSPRRSRGLCENDYTKAKRLVRLGRVTWAQLEAAGKCLSTQDPATKWLLEAAESQPETETKP